MIPDSQVGIDSAAQLGDHGADESLVIPVVGGIGFIIDAVGKVGFVIDRRPECHHSPQRSDVGDRDFDGHLRLGHALRAAARTCCQSSPYPVGADAENHGGVFRVGRELFEIEIGGGVERTDTRKDIPVAAPVQSVAVLLGDELPGQLVGRVAVEVGSVAESHVIACCGIRRRHCHVHPRCGDPLESDREGAVIGRHERLRAESVCPEIGRGHAAFVESEGEQHVFGIGIQLPERIAVVADGQEVGERIVVSGHLPDLHRLTDVLDIGLNHLIGGSERIEGLALYAIPEIGAALVGGGHLDVGPESRPTGDGESERAVDAPHRLGAEEAFDNAGGRLSERGHPIRIGIILRVGLQPLDPAAPRFGRKVVGEHLLESHFVKLRTLADILQVVGDIGLVVRKAVEIGLLGDQREIGAHALCGNPLHRDLRGSGLGAGDSEERLLAGSGLTNDDTHRLRTG